MVAKNRELHASDFLTNTGCVHCRSKTDIIEFKCWAGIIKLCKDCILKSLLNDNQKLEYKDKENLSTINKENIIKLHNETVKFVTWVKKHNFHYLRNKKDFSNGGACVAIDVYPVITNNGQYGNVVLSFAYSLCSVKDNFSYSIGRERAYYALQRPVRYQDYPGKLPNIKYVFGEMKTTKSKGLKYTCDELIDFFKEFVLKEIEIQTGFKHYIRSGGQFSDE